VNYRRRMSQDRLSTYRSPECAALSPLPALDDLGRALGATPPELATHPWVQGLFLG